MFSPLPQQVIASMFVNEEKYLVLSNLSEEPYTLSLRDEWVNRETDEKASTFSIPVGGLVFLKKVQ